MNYNHVIIVAGGSGTRMNHSLPKQYLKLGTKPILMHTIEAFYMAQSKPQIVVVIHPDMGQLWKKLCREYNFQISHHIIAGGPTRFQSVQNGITYLKSTIDQPNLHCIAVHDGARPLIRTKIIDLSFEMAKEKRAVIVGCKSTNSVRIEKDGTNKSVNRDSVWLIQTPQTFGADLLFEAYQQREQDTFTDDASVVEKLGNTITLLEGHYSNLKITYKEDIDIAQLYLQSL